MSISGAVSIRARFRRLHAGDQGLIAAPWTPASLSLLTAIKISTDPETARSIPTIP